MGRPGKIGASVNELDKLLRAFNLLEERNLEPNSIDGFMSSIRGLNYSETWKVILREDVFDFRLRDNSLIVISATSIAYYSCPYQCLNYDDFIIEFEFSDEDDVDFLEAAYEEYLFGRPLDESPVMFRYDYDPRSYNEGLHPSSHLHIGHCTQIRIGFKSILDPFSFGLLILRQHYPKIYKEMLDDTKYHSILASFKKSLTPIDGAHHNPKDHWEFYLT
ncbi:MAG TPA: DUF2290 domain-containing protein [Bacteroidia bacterium]|jgi:hypothetical protein|nr:DUF2290 domain-containing protein [Bacteroidia bacterium]